MLSAELARRGHSVTIAAPEGELARRSEATNLKIAKGFHFRSPGRLRLFLADRSRMSALLKRQAFDIVDVHGSQDSWVTATVRAATGLPRCLVMTRHNTKRVRTNPANRWLYGRVDHLILVDESIRERYRPFLEGGILDNARVSVIPSAYRADLFHEGVDGTRVRRELGLPPGAVAVGVAGRLVEDKGHVHLLRAAASLRESLPGIVLVFAGAGPNRPAIEAEIARLGLGGSVRILGFRQDIAEVQAAFDVAVLPSVGCDASSASIKEAMALGVPAIASDIGGARGIIDDGVTGTIVPPADPGALASALARLIGDPASARAMAERGRRKVAGAYTIERLADGTLEAYERALAHAGLATGAEHGARRMRAGGTA